MAIYSNENITKITKLSHREFPHFAQNRENIYAKYMAYAVSLQMAKKIIAMKPR